MGLEDLVTAGARGENLHTPLALAVDPALASAGECKGRG